VQTLVWGLLIPLHLPAAWFSNNAKSCHDQIVHWIATLCLLHFDGIKWGPITSLFQTLELADRHIQMAFGDSVQTFTSTLSRPYRVVGQGNGTGLEIWVAISAILIPMMTIAGVGLHQLTTSISATLVTAVCFAFMDDTDVLHAASHPDHDGRRILHELQQVTTTWAGGVRATVGTIWPDKS
jgi:hypothetical protein